MIARITFASLALALLTIPVLTAPAMGAAGPATVSVVVPVPPTMTATGTALATLKDASGAPMAGVTLHIIISWKPLPDVSKPSTLQQIAVTTGSDGVATITIPFDQSTAKINFVGDHGIQVVLDGTSTSDAVAYQVGTGLA